MLDVITYINRRLDHLALLPLAFCGVLAFAVLATAVVGDTEPPAVKVAANDDLTTIADAVP